MSLRQEQLPGSIAHVEDKQLTTARRRASGDKQSLCIATEVQRSDPVRNQLRLIDGTDRSLKSPTGIQFPDPN